MTFMIILLAVLALWTAVVVVVSYRVVRKATLADVRPIVIGLEQKAKDLRIALGTKQYQQFGLRFDAARDAAINVEDNSYLSPEEEADCKMKAL